MHTLKSDRIAAQFSQLGAKLVSLIIDGVDVVVGPATDAEALASDTFTGAIMGRMAGRIAGARFPLEGRIIKLTPNMGEDQLHGGPENFSTAIWQVQPIPQGLRFSHTSPAGDQGYPGEVTAHATYRLDGNTLSLELEATTTAITVLNLTNHAYWNLQGQSSGLTQGVQIHADHYLPLSDAKLPTGEIRQVEGTAYDFRTMRPVAQAYDTCFCLNGERGTLRHGLTLRDPHSGRSMEVHTTEPAIQFYTADHFNPDMPGETGPLQPHNAIAIEPQNYPDAPNHSNFPSSVFTPEEPYFHRVEWRFKN